jgi:hypothetical protein
MNTQFPVTTVTAENLDKVGFFCYMSARKTPGYACKKGWVNDHLAEGLQIRMVLPPEGRGFIEYIPGEYAWRAVNAEGYLFIHCLWVVGKSKGQGVAAHLMDLCEQEALESGRIGVAMVTGEDHYIVKKKYLENRGYISTDTAPPAFNLMVKKFRDGPAPSFCGDWEHKVDALRTGLTVLRADQCPYLESAVSGYTRMAEEIGVPFKDILLKSADEVRRKAPSAFGVFSLVYNGHYIGDQYLDKDTLRKRIAAVDSGEMLNSLVSHS